MSDIVSFSTKSYWEAWSIRDFIRRFLTDHQVPEDGIEWIRADISPARLPFQVMSPSMFPSPRWKLREYL